MGWLADRFKGALDHWVEGLIVLGSTAAGLAVWRLLRRHQHIPAHVSVPTWAIGLVLGLVLAGFALLGFRLRLRGGQIQTLAGGVEDMADVVRYSEQAREITVAYADHLLEILYTFRQVLNGDIPGVTVKEWIEDGILEPARDLIRTRQPADVRLSILVPDGDDFVMALAAGHALESKARFRLPIDQSFSRWSYQTNEIIWSGELATDDRFLRHPRSTPDRDYESMISVPISSGGSVVAVLNAIFAAENAFDAADLLYVRLLGAVIQLAWEISGGP